ncbi:MAG: 30S ribosomal protein S8 [bacterium]|nr:30S ribosomal protein S8 [bacterium]MDT8395894.1 30S ribosomal protein S8 [bacterium]
MSMTDPIADMLTRVRNALMSGKEKVDVPASTVKEGIARILRDEGYIINYRVIEDNKQGIIRITLKYGEVDTPAIEKLQRISKPGRRVYVPAKEVPRVLNGLGIAILSTSKGILTNRESKLQNVGGEVLCYIW